MSTGAIVLTVIGCIVIILIAVRAAWELKHPKVTVLKVVSPKVRNNTRIVYLSDLHGRTYGENNAQLIELIEQQNPDYIFLGGDLAVASPGKKDETAIRFIKEVCLISPVFYAPGNHEKHLAINPGLFGGRYNAIKEAVIQAGGTYLENASVSLKDNMVIYGLDIDFRYYVKFRKAPFLTESELNNYLGALDKEKFNILLAHSPKYFRTYAAWGADLSFSGHYHGGAVRIPGVGGLISPQFVPFPKYSGGLYKEKEATLFVSRGIGSHKVNLRLNNRPEVAVIDICSQA